MLRLLPLMECVSVSRILIFETPRLKLAYHCTHWFSLQVCYVCRRVAKARSWLSRLSDSTSPESGFPCTSRVQSEKGSLVHTVPASGSYSWTVLPAVRPTITVIVSSTVQAAKKALCRGLYWGSDLQAQLLPSHRCSQLQKSGCLRPTAEAEALLTVLDNGMTEAKSHPLSELH